MQRFAESCAVTAKQILFLKKNAQTPVEEGFKELPCRSGRLAHSKQAALPDLRHVLLSPNFFSFGQVGIGMPRSTCMSYHAFGIQKLLPTNIWGSLASHVIDGEPTPLLYERLPLLRQEVAS